MDSFTAIWEQDEKEVERLIDDDGWELSAVIEKKPYWKNHLLVKEDKIKLNKIIQGDCLIEMAKIDDKSIDMILCDLPYGTTACHWDTIIPFEPLWSAYKRIIKDNGAIVLTASQPFTSKLIMSNLEMFKYELIWEKAMATGFLNANRMPMRNHENILIFYKKLPKYNPQKTKGKPYKIKAGSETENYGDVKNGFITNNEDGLRHPKSIIKINHDKEKLHPTQKPVALFEYLIRTYTNEGDLVLDNCAGSFTTAIACMKTNRNWICIEKEKKYCDIGQERIKQELSQMKLF
jgi:site-specific DNA-methyltransferase (adenine-specific)